MKKRYRLLEGMFLAALIFAGIHSRTMTARAEEDFSDKCGLKEFELIYDESFDHISSDEKYSVPENVKAYWTSFSNDYYYDQLSAVQRQLWDALEEECALLAASEKTAEYASVTFDVSPDSISRDDLRNLLWMFKYSNPQYYFLTSSIAWGSKTAGIKLYEAFQDGASRASATYVFCERVNEWVRQVAKAGREEEKVKLAHDIVAENTVYEGGTYDQSAYSMVCEGRTVCAGYAASLQLLLNPNGITTIEITSKNHGWNNVLVHGQWYAVDVTWDDHDTVYYRYYMRSNATLTKGGTDESHLAIDRWVAYMPELNYDSIISNSYYSPYFAENGRTYFTVNDNTDIGARCAFVLDDSDNTAPPTVLYNENEYIVINVPAGRRVVPHYDLREDGGVWDGTYYTLDGQVVVDAFFCDGTYTYYLMTDGTAMKDRLTYHPDGDHVIYFDADGHEVFNDFALVGYNIPAVEDDGSITLIPLNEYCYFDGSGYQYTNVVTWGKDGTDRGGKLFYANPGGVLARGGWFTFSDDVKYAGDGSTWGAAGRRGYANEDLSLMRETYTYDEGNNYCYIDSYGGVQ